MNPNDTYDFIKNIQSVFINLLYFKDNYKINIGNKLIIELINLTLHILKIYKNNEVLIATLCGGCNVCLAKRIYDNNSEKYQQIFLKIRIDELEIFMRKICAINCPDLETLEKLLKDNFSS